MQPLAVVGPDAQAVVDQLASQLAETGAVGTVSVTESLASAVTPASDGSADENDAVGPPGSTHHYSLSADGWVGSGTDRSLTDALDALAVACEYGLVAGRTQRRLPTVVLGEASVPDTARVLVRERRAEDVDTETLCDELETVPAYETLESLVADIKREADETFSGAIATFTGRVRAREDSQDEPTRYLEFEQYDPVAKERLATLREELESRDGILSVRLHHRTGRVVAGEDIVFVVILAGHRGEAFRAVEDGINRLKAEVPLFKKEVTTTETFWAHQHDPSR